MLESRATEPAEKVNSLIAIPLAFEALNRALELPRVGEEAQAGVAALGVDQRPLLPGDLNANTTCLRCL
jgi:hypothetical protein